MSLTAYLDRVRGDQGLLSIAQVIELASSENVVYDPCSVLISKHAIIGRKNIFFPGVYLLCEEHGALKIGDENIFHANTLLEATSGSIELGSRNQFGEGGFTAKANRRGARITIENSGRYLNGPAVFGKTFLGSGSQLLGAITVDDCTLEAGGSYKEPDPDKRAGLLKGSGVARTITVPRGHVIVGAGSFLLSDLQPQIKFHPKG